MPPDRTCIDGPRGVVKRCLRFTADLHVSVRPRFGARRRRFAALCRLIRWCASAGKDAGNGVDWKGHFVVKSGIQWTVTISTSPSHARLKIDMVDHHTRIFVRSVVIVVTKRLR